MPSGLLSNLNLASRFTFHSVTVRVKLPPTLCSIEAPLSNSSVKLLRYSSSTRCGVRIMASSGSVAASGDLVVDSLVSSHGSLSSFVKSSGVFFNDGSLRSCRRGRVSMRIECRMGAQGCMSYGSSAGFLKGLPDCRNFSSSCYSDRVVPQVSTEEPLGAEPLSSLAIPAEPTPSPSILKLLSGACYLPHPAKEETGGEDAYFICVDEQAIGVADGVGGWADVGVNAGLYARELMSNSVKAIKEVASGNVDPLMVLEKAHAQTKALGSSTACIITLKNKTLHAINLGDSGFIIVRDGRIIFESPVQQHGFNFTYQLENNTRGDQPTSGDVFEIPVVPGDVIVAGSDGLYDNLYSKEVAAIVGDSVKHGLSPDGTAQKIADFARARALDSKHQTPFSTAAQEAGFSYYGGKLDDLTVVVSYVSA